MSQGTLLILSGPSGAGKSTVIHRILERHPEGASETEWTTISLRLPSLKI